jgi:hypothetical protein
VGSLKNKFTSFQTLNSLYSFDLYNINVIIYNFRYFDCLKLTVFISWDPLGSMDAM